MLEICFYTQSFDEDRVAVPLPKLGVSDQASHAAGVVLRGPGETLTSVHSPAVQCAANGRRGHRCWQLGKTLSIKNFSVLFGSWLVVYCLYSSSFVCWTGPGSKQKSRIELVLVIIDPICLVWACNIRQRLDKSWMISSVGGCKRLSIYLFI